MSASAVRRAKAPTGSSIAAAPARATIAAALALLGALALLAALAPAANALPANRAYEKVSPNDKDGNDIINGSNKAAADGNGAVYAATAAFADSEGAGILNSFHSARTPGGWMAEGIFPPQQPQPGLNFSLFEDFSEDAASGIYIGRVPSIPGSAPDTQNVYRTNPDGSIDLISFGQPPPVSFSPSPNYGGSADDLSVATFSIDTDPAIPVTEGPAGVDGALNAYAGDGTNLELVSVLPDGTAAPGGGWIGASSFRPGYNAVSDDGSRIVWSTDIAGDQELFVRLDGTDSEWVSESERTPPDTISQGKAFQYATPDGDFAFFTSSEALTNDTVIPPSTRTEWLYRYNVATGDLVNLTTADPNGANVEGVLGVSDDGQRVYFAATGDLAPNIPPTIPTGQTKLYVRDGATTTFIAPLQTSGFPSDRTNWDTRYASKLARVTPDGRFLLFGSLHEQRDYDNAGFIEIYRYDLQADELTCISCNPSGAAATGDAALTSPPTDATDISGLALSERHNLTADGGTAFFVSPERLLAADTNGKYDVYMWENGSLELISSGQSADHSGFVDASVDGEDAFFLTRERLVGIDRDNDVDLYDARVGGGIAAQNPPPPAAPCLGAACKPPASAQSTVPTPGTATVHSPPRAAPPDCTSLESKADRKAKKAKKAKKKAKKAKKKAKKLKRKAKKASGKKANKLQKKAKKAKKQAKKKKKQAKKKHKKAKKAKQKARDCKRGQG